MGEVVAVQSSGVADRAEPGVDALLALLAEMLAMKQEAIRSLVQAILVARDALQPLADNRPVSGPAQRALVTIALMSLGQASDALAELEVVMQRSESVNITKQEP